MQPTLLRPDLSIIAGWIAKQARVLDLGCGDGSLLHYLTQNKQVAGVGVDIEPGNLLSCLNRGIDIIQTDLENGLAGFEDNAFDVVILSQTLQTIHHTEKMVKELLRVGREAIVTFPNFGHWTIRTQFSWRGRMPVSKELPYQWYNTPNIHLFTIKDFDALCRDQGIKIIERHTLRQGRPVHWWPNLFGTLAIYRLCR